MASVTQIRKAIAARCGTIAGLNAYPTAPGQVVVPAAIVLPGPIAYDATMRRGSDDFTFTLRLLASQASSDAGQDALDAYVSSSGPSSIKSVVDGDLDGVVDFARVASMDSYGEIEWNGVLYLGADFTVEVTASGEV